MGIFFFPNIVFTQSQEQKTRAWAPGTPSSRSPYTLTRNMRFLEGFRHPHPHPPQHTVPPSLCAHHTGMSRAEQSQARSYLGDSHQVSSPTGLNTKRNSVWKRKAASGLHRQTPNHKALSDTCSHFTDGETEAQRRHSIPGPVQHVPNKQQGRMQRQLPLHQPGPLQPL